MKPSRAPNFGTYFVSASTWGRRDLFRSVPMARLLLDTLYHYRAEGRFALHEFVIMPDHIHLLVTPNGITLERVLQFIKGGYSHRVSTELNSRLEIWQRGFTDHRIRDAEDYERHRLYIRENPVRARLVENQRNYPYSSAAPGFELDDVPQRLKPMDLNVTLRHG
jgi:REP-associated tyrosine transposase